MENMREQSLRELIFSIGILALLWTFALNYAAGWVNAALLSYFTLCGLCVVVVILSVMWWWRTDGTSAVFRMLVLLASGMGIDAAVQAWSRYLWLSGQHVQFDMFRKTWIWDYRQVIEIVALVYLLAVIISRMSEKRGHYVP